VSLALIDRIARPSAPSSINRPTRRAGRKQRRLLGEQDRLTARLAELYRIKALLGDALTVVSSGWVQHDWFVVTNDDGNPVRINAHSVHTVTNRPVVGACLVGAIVHAGGGPAAARSQLVQRSLDVTWHALHEEQDRAVQWCPAPTVRTAHVRDLTRWNDHPQRNASEVTALFRTAIGTATAQTSLVRQAAARASAGS
jgi:hypothetical protein